ncbi:MAG: hypothetical protein NT161_00110 [Candidatus Nomurabacteria bacterium]|nr:hypothetical protein [Candidatus Nomurabacteria bacterium]
MNSKKGQNKICQNCKQDFVIETEDFEFYEKIKVPPPTFCSDCRLQRRLATYNARNLYKRNCDRCNISIISVFSAGIDSKVYCTKCYFSDDWDATLYGKDYDFSKTFFIQFDELRKNVPQIHLRHSNNGDNCEYANSVYHSSNVYLSYGVVASQDIYYGSLINKGNKTCLDCYNIKNNEYIYELVNSNGNFKCIYLTNSHQCLESSFLFNCINCQNCFMSSNLRNKNYCFRNKQLTKKEYEQKISELKLGNSSEFEKITEEYYNMIKNSIYRYATIIKSTDDCTGDMLENCKNVKNSFNIYDCENLKFSIFLMNKNTDSYDLTISGRGERNYDLITSAGGSFDCKFGNRATGNNLEYVDTCNGEDLFGCVGLKKKQYCILNKQYSKEEYFNLRKKIINHMTDMPYIDKKNRIYKYGEFFPIELSQFAYNDTLAIQFFPLAKDQILNEGYKWKDFNNKDYQISIISSELPENIEMVNNSILKETILCKDKEDCKHGCTKGYKIIEEELKFYQKMKLPLPKYCPNCRYYNRLRRTNSWKLFYRQCMCDYKVFKNTILHSQHKEGRCLNKFETAYKNETQEIIYCKQCYQQELL